MTEKNGVQDQPCLPRPETHRLTERSVSMDEPIMMPCGRKELFWDGYLADPERTTAVHRLLPPAEKECSFLFDRGEERHSVSYPNLVRDEAGYKLYYMSFNPAMPFEKRRFRLHVLESGDGMHWTRPDLQLFPDEYPGANNIVIDGMDESSLCVFYDTNPACPPEDKYKVLTMVFLDRTTDRRSLWCWLSPDGYHFRKGYMLTDRGRFDTLNSTFWKDGLYCSFVRDLHGSWETGVVRDVRMMTSEDFVHWSDPVPLEYDDGMDTQMYTNNIMPCPGASHMFLGMPTRYVERQVWTKNDDQFGSAVSKRRAAESIELRCGLAVTDLQFMCSRDGVHFHRYPDAYLTPGPETEHNWIYGDCYASWPLLDSGNTWSFYLYKNGMTADTPKELWRYELRKDGFACMIAEGGEKQVVTRPLVYEGSSLHLNMATSGYGSVYVTVLNEAGVPLSEESVELYGDSTDRTVYFPDGSGDFSPWAGKPVRLQFRMRDAKLYSMEIR